MVISGSDEWYGDMKQYVEVGIFRYTMTTKDGQFVKRRSNRFVVFHGSLYNKNSVGDPQ